MMKSSSSVARCLATLGFTLAASACTEPTQPAPVVPPLNPRAVAICSVDVRALTLICSDARVSETIVTGMQKDIVIGGQDVFVKLSSTATSYDGTSVFSSSVNVQNLLRYSMGTADGSTTSGVDVFFDSGPTVTSGSGSISVANPDGVGSFTKPNQPFFHYGQILTPFALSVYHTWQFNVPSTVNTFTFRVYVSSPINGDEQSQLLGDIWTGAASSAWADPANWSNGVVPNDSTTATVPTDSLLSSRRYPLASSNISVANVRVGAGSSLALGGFSLATAGNVDAPGSVMGGTIRMNGGAALIGGTVDALVITGSVRLQRPTTATGAVAITDGHLTVADKPLTISLQ